MEKKKRNFVEWAMHYRQIVILVVTCLVAFGVYSLPEMRKNEFPDFTVRQGVVVAVAPEIRRRKWWSRLPNRWKNTFSLIRK